MTDPTAVVDHIRPGADVIVPMANGEPVGLLDALEAEHARLRSVRVHQMHALHERRYIEGAYPGQLRHVSYFLSPATRQAYWAGGCDLVPNHFSEMPHLLRTETNCSIVLAAASPPDRHGYFSLGTNAEYVAPLIGRVPFFLEVNQQMPRTQGLNQLHASQVLGWTEADRPLVEVAPIRPDDRDRAIADSVVERIPDGATLQVGIGGIPNAVLAGLSGHRHLGIHTELLSDGIVDLVEQGVVTGTRKRLRPNKIVTTFALGTQRLYDWLHENTAVEFLPVDYVNDPRTVARERDFVSINATTEVDLYGQCASETIAGRYWSSSGGQADFARGAMYSEGGQAFIVLHSTTSRGESRIKLHLTEGSVVTTLKNTVDHVVTEWGIARLRGRSIAERARALIDIAHPDHREALERDARAAGLLQPSVIDHAGGRAAADGAPVRSQARHMSTRTADPAALREGIVTVLDDLERDLGLASPRAKVNRAGWGAVRTEVCAESRGMRDLVHHLLPRTPEPAPAAAGEGQPRGVGSGQDRGVCRKSRHRVAPRRAGCRCHRSSGPPAPRRSEPRRPRAR